jgi:hypothetical protein
MAELPIFTEDDLTPEEFAPLWGADPVYCKPPQEPGDGYKFYNFSDLQGKPDFLREFLPAIDRTIQLIQLHRQADGEKTFTSEDLYDMKEFRKYVQALLEEQNG